MHSGLPAPSREILSGSCPFIAGCRIKTAPRPENALPHNADGEIDVFRAAPDRSARGLAAFERRYPWNRHRCLDGLSSIAFLICSRAILSTAAASGCSVARSMASPAHVR